MNDVHHLNTRGRDPVENNIVRVRHDLSQTWYAQTWFVKVRMLCRMLQVMFYAFKKMLCGLFVSFADEVEYFQQVGMR